MSLLTILANYNSSGSGISSSGSIDNNISLYLYGHIAINSNCTLFTTGMGTPNNNIPLFISSPTPSSSGNFSLYTSGKMLYSNSSTLYTIGEPISKNTTLYINGAYISNKYLNLTCFGIPLPANSIPLFIKGDGTTSGGYPKTSMLNLFINRPNVGNAISLFLNAQPPVINSLNLSLNGDIPVTGSMPLSIPGTIGAPNTICNLYTHGY